MPDHEQNPGPPAVGTPVGTQVAIWDLPIRLFHWLLAVLLVFSWVTQWRGWMELHYLSGQAILALLLFRVTWGFLGSDTARFRFFLKSPAAALRHLMHLRRREPDTELGHNAAGGWMVLGLLALLFAQVVTGLFSNDDDALIEGPLRHLVSRNLSDWLTHLHALTFNLIEIAIVLHVLAIAVYLALKGHNLVRPMIIGHKTMPRPEAVPSVVSTFRAVVIFVLALVAVVALVRWM